MDLVEDNKGTGRQLPSERLADLFKELSLPRLDLLVVDDACRY